MADMVAMVTDSLQSLAAFHRHQALTRHSSHIPITSWPLIYDRPRPDRP
jgi:hypothetical protein